MSRRRSIRTGDAVFPRSYTDSYGNIRKTSTYYFDFLDQFGIEHRIPATTNRAASVEIKRKVKELVAYRIAGKDMDGRLTNFLESYRHRDKLAKWGIIPQVWAGMDKTIFEHIDEYARALGETLHAKEVKGKLYRIALDNGWQSIADIDADGYAEWRVARAEGEDRLNSLPLDENDDDDEKTKKEKRRNRERLRLAPRSLQHFTTRIKAFTAWLVKKGLLYTDPLEKMELRKITMKKVYVRIPFKPSEVERIIAAAASSDDRVEGMNGLERALFYQLVYGTGLRHGEGKMLRKEYFFLDADIPHVFIPAADGVTKNDKDARLPLTPELVNALRPHLENVLAGKMVFSGGLRKGKGMKMLRVDMENAGIKEMDQLGRHRDFHGFRHSYATVLCKSGVPLTMAQKMMRHSEPALTAEFYVHAELEDMARELAKVPKVNIDIWQEMMKRNEESDAAKAG